MTVRPRSTRTLLAAWWKRCDRGHKTAAVACAAVFALFVGLNYSYLDAHIRYAVSPNPKNGTPAPSGPSMATTSAALPPDTLTIDRLGIRAPIRYVTEKSEKAYQRALQSGVAHYPGTAAPGEVGNAYIFGHSSDYSWSRGSYKTVFALLTKIRTGDLIRASDADGKTFTYRVSHTKVVSPRDLSVLDQGDGSKKLLTLQTSYPLGTALKRFIVVSELVE